MKFSRYNVKLDKRDDGSTLTIMKAFLQRSYTRGITALNVIPWWVTAHRANQTQQPTMPSKVPIYSWVERSTYGNVSCWRTYKHYSRGRGSNPHSDVSAIRTQIQCTKPLGHGTPWLFSINNYFWVAVTFLKSDKFQKIPDRLFNIIIS